MRAVIYARFSTELQSVASIDDQARLCRERATALGLTVVAVHSDRAVSGATPVDRRPGASACVADALAGRFDVLLIESLDRLSRNLVEQETVIRRLEHRGVRIVGVSDGYDSTSGAGRKLLRGMRGLISETYLDDLRAKTHRGLTGQIERGYHAGGLSYGYRSIVAGVNGRGEAIGHRLEIDQAQAAIVRDIFGRYAAGASCQRIAADLNARGVRGPRGGTWCVSALYGSRAKGAGVLNNELYVGRYVWNRSQWIKNPDTGRRERFIRPESEWQSVARPELRILDDEPWQAVRERMASPRRAGGRKGRGGVPTTLLGGILRCGQCGGAVVKVNARTYGCAAHKDRGPAVCGGVAASHADVDRVVLDYVRGALTAPDVLAWIEQEALRRADELARASYQVDDRAREQRVQREIERLTDAVAQMGLSTALADRLRKAEAERDALKRARTRAAVAPLPLAIRAQVHALVAGLDVALRTDVARARDALRAVLGDVQLIEENGAVYAECDNAAERLLLAVGGVSMGRVAGARNLTQRHVRIR
jgi:DNA invertase Pin-like site-specific DNA recombinase